MKIYFIIQVDIRTFLCLWYANRNILPHIGVEKSWGWRGREGSLGTIIIDWWKQNKTGGVTRNDIKFSNCDRHGFLHKCSGLNFGSCVFSSKAYENCLGVKTILRVLSLNTACLLLKLQFCKFMSRTNSGWFKNLIHNKQKDVLTYRW